MVSAKQGKLLYEGTKALIVENLDKLAKTHIVPTFRVGTQDDAVQDSTQGEQLLKAFRLVWEDHTSSMSKLRDILKYMVSLNAVFVRFAHQTRAINPDLFNRTVCTVNRKEFPKYGTLDCSSSSIESFVRHCIQFSNTSSALCYVKSG